jgi:methionyl-tRNA formyltransferase
MAREGFRIIFMGTPDFAVPSLNALLQGPDRVVAVVSQPDRPKGRSRRPMPPPIKSVAALHGLPVLQPEKIKTPDFFAALESYAPDLIVVAAYGRILPPSLLNLPKHGCINVHGSLLPRHRGAAPIQWALIKGDAEVGVTIMQMDEGMDTGDILLTDSLRPGPEETAGSLLPKLAELGSQALMDTIDLLGQGGLATMKQDEALATTAPMLKKEDGLVDWGRPALHIDRLIRGLDPWPTAYSFLDGRKLQLFAPAVTGDESSQPPGTVLRADRDGLLVATTHQSLLIREVKPEGRGRMSIASFLNGYPLTAGCRLTDPPE